MVFYKKKLFIAACGYVADKIRGLCSGKSEGEKKGIKGIKERPCVISNGTGPKGNHNMYFAKYHMKFVIL